MTKIEKLINNNPDSVQGETDAGPMEIAKKVNELIDVVNEDVLRKIKKLILEKGDRLVVESGSISQDQVEDMGERFKCEILIVPDIKKIGVLKFDDED